MVVTMWYRTVSWELFHCFCSHLTARRHIPDNL
jgi:hypothetical protein